MGLFLELARKWPELMRFWGDIEQILPPLRTQFEKRKLAVKIRIITFTVMIISLGKYFVKSKNRIKIFHYLLLSKAEHVLSMVTIVESTKRCKVHENSEDFVKDFFFAQLSQLFAVTEYAVWKAFLGKYLNIICTFLWSYMDLFVMLMSVGLSSRLKILNDDLERVKGLNMSAVYWSKRRLQYRRLCILVEHIDNAMSKLTIISFTNNLFFVCVQLLRSLK